MVAREGTTRRTFEGIATNDRGCLARCFQGEWYRLLYVRLRDWRLVIFAVTEHLLRCAKSSFRSFRLFQIPNRANPQTYYRSSRTRQEVNSLQAQRCRCRMYRCTACHESGRRSRRFVLLHGRSFPIQWRTRCVRRDRCWPGMILLLSCPKSSKADRSRSNKGRRWFARSTRRITRNQVSTERSHRSRRKHVPHPRQDPRFLPLGIATLPSWSFRQPFTLALFPSRPSRSRLFPLSRKPVIRHRCRPESCCLCPQPWRWSRSNSRTIRTLAQQASWDLELVRYRGKSSSTGRDEDIAIFERAVPVRPANPSLSRDQTLTRSQSKQILWSWRSRAVHPTSNGSTSSSLCGHDALGLLVWNSERSRGFRSYGNSLQLYDSWLVSLFSSFCTSLTRYWIIVISPALVANLWDVTDKDIDKFAQSVFIKTGIASSTSPPPTSTLSLTAAVAQSRNQCHLRYLNGAAPVVYGIPVRFLQK